MEYKGEKYEDKTFEVDGYKFTAKPCMKSGFCCTKAPCGYGEWNETKTECKYLLPPNEIKQRGCGRYDWIKENVPNWEMYPAFGAGCCMPLGNTKRQDIINKIKAMDYEAQIDRIKDVTNSIKVGHVTVLTGKNGSGKSLVRKMLGSAIAEQTGGNPSKSVASVSMESRTQKKYEFSALSALGIDDPENPTSCETLNNFKMITNYVKKDQPRYIVIDEPEIGMGEEMVCSLAALINKTFEVLPEGCLGVLVITHNRYLVENINGEFLNMEGMDRESWLNRKIIPVDLPKLEEDALGLWRAINKRIEENKKNKQ